MATPCRKRNKGSSGTLAEAIDHLQTILTDENSSDKPVLRATVNQAEANIGLKLCPPLPMLEMMWMERYPIGPVMAFVDGDAPSDDDTISNAIESINETLGEQEKVSLFGALQVLGKKLSWPAQFMNSLIPLEQLGAKKSKNKEATPEKPKDEEMVDKENMNPNAGGSAYSVVDSEKYSQADSDDLRMEDCDSQSEFDTSFYANEPFDVMPRASRVADRQCRPQWNLQKWHAKEAERLETLKNEQEENDKLKSTFGPSAAKLSRSSSSTMEERTAENIQMWNKNEAFQILSSELVNVQKASLSSDPSNHGVVADAVDFDAHHWEVTVRHFTGPLLDDFQRVKQLFGYDGLTFRMRFKEDLHPFYPPKISLIRPRLKGAFDLQAAIFHHPRLTLRRWPAFNTCLQVIDHIKHFLERHARVDLECAMNCSKSFPDGAYCRLERDLALLGHILDHVPPGLRLTDPDNPYTEDPWMQMDCGLETCTLDNRKARPSDKQKDMKELSSLIKECDRVGISRVPGMSQFGYGQDHLETTGISPPPGLFIDSGPIGDGPPWLTTGTAAWAPKSSDDKKHTWAKGTGYGHDSMTSRRMLDVLLKIQKQWFNSSKKAANTQDQAKVEVMKKVDTMIDKMHMQMTVKNRTDSWDFEQSQRMQDAQDEEFRMLLHSIANGLQEWDRNGLASQHRLEQILTQSCLTNFMVVESESSWMTISDRPQFYTAFVKMVEVIFDRAPDCSACRSLAYGTYSRGHFQRLAQQAQMFVNALDNDKSSSGGARGSNSNIPSQALSAPEVSSASAAVLPSKKPHVHKIMSKQEISLNLASQFVLVCAKVKRVGPTLAPLIGTSVSASSREPASGVVSQSSSSTGAAAQQQQAGHDHHGYLEIMKSLQFSQVELPDKEGSHYYLKRMGEKTRSSKRDLRLAIEAAGIKPLLPMSWSSSMIVHIDEARTNLWRCAIVGPEDTPYSGGVFLFDIYFAADYPANPPQVNMITNAKNTVRFNPNLYANGTVCLSLLGTWRGAAGENWDASTSKVVQVLISIQSMIMVPEPYFNEPGHEREMGTPHGTTKSLCYNHQIREYMIKVAVYDSKKQRILDQVDGWILEASTVGAKDDRKAPRVMCVDEGGAGKKHARMGLSTTLADSKKSHKEKMTSLRKDLVLAFDVNDKKYHKLPPLEDSDDE